MSQENTKKFKSKDILFQLVFLAIGIGLFVYVIKEFKFEEIVATLKSAKIAPIVLVVFISLVGHLLRAWRWQLMMDQTGKSNFWNLLFSLQLGYFVSLAIPRIGEFVKCFTSAETEKKTVSFVFGTIMSERIVDFVIFAILFALAFAFKADVIYEFWASLLDLFKGKLWMAGVLVAAVVIILPMVNKMSTGESNELQLTEGLKSALKVEQKGYFWLATLSIWGCYFLTSYVLFFSFDPTSVLTMGDGFLTMVGGTVSRMLPLNGGGIGAYHAVITKLLSSMGIDELLGASYAILNHGIQFIFQIVVGVISVFFLSKKVNLKNIAKLNF
jgi:glycosyltransferase 2 family protein